MILESFIYVFYYHLNDMVMSTGGQWTVWFSNIFSGEQSPTAEML